MTKMSRMAIKKLTDTRKNASTVTISNVRISVGYGNNKLN